MVNLVLRFPPYIVRATYFMDKYINYETDHENNLKNCTGSIDR